MALESHKKLTIVVALLEGVIKKLGGLKTIFKNIIVNTVLRTHTHTHTTLSNAPIHTLRLTFTAWG